MWPQNMWSIKTDVSAEVFQTCVWVWPHKNNQISESFQMNTVFDSHTFLVQIHEQNVSSHGAPRDQLSGLVVMSTLRLVACGLDPQLGHTISNQTVNMVAIVFLLGISIQGWNCGLSSANNSWVQLRCCPPTPQGLRTTSFSLLELFI